MRHPVAGVSLVRNRRGIALLLTLLLALLVVSLAIGVLLMMTSTTLVTRYHMSESMMSNLAAGGLEQARDTLNGTPSLLPRPSGFVTLESNATLRDANNVVIPGLTRSTYAGLTGGATGQAGLYTSVLSVISNTRGPVVVRRADYRQGSLAGYERFYDNWPSGSLGPGDAVFGPVHSNRDIRLSSSSPGSRFWSRVTAVNSITNAGASTFYGGTQAGAASIPFPTASQVGALQPIAATGGMVVVGDLRMNAEDPEVRIEFIAMDLNGDGDTMDENEGFFRVFRIPPAGTSEDRDYVTARRWGRISGWTGSASANNSDDPNLLSPNCGGVLQEGGGPVWRTADEIVNDSLVGYGPPPPSRLRRDSVRTALSGNRRRCFLGGDRRLFGNEWVVTTPHGAFAPWPGWSGAPPGALVAAITAQGFSSATTAADVAQTFWPLGEAFNPAWRGVVYLTGSVAVSGLLRGRLTLAATGNVMIADDITYVSGPNTTCADILGLISRESVLLQDNNVNSPFRVDGSTTVVFDDTPDEIIHGFLMGLDLVGGEDLSGGENVVAPEDCGGLVSSSRGCRFLVGGIASGVYATSYSGSTGWHDQDHYDECGRVNPPPYYPTTGQFTKYRYYEIDPVGFNPTAWFAANQ